MGQKERQGPVRSKCVAPHLGNGEEGAAVGGPRGGAMDEPLAALPLAEGHKARGGSAGGGGAQEKLGVLEEARMVRKGVGIGEDDHLWQRRVRSALP